MSIQQKILQYQGLSEYETSIVDSLPTSEYFKVFSLEDTIPGGRSTFQILGSEFLEDGVEIKIELLDINGNPIYTEPIKYLGDDPSRHIMIEVYPDTPAGVGKLTILGSATNVPDEWKGLYNVKWEKDVFIDPVSKNTQPILFKGQGFDLTRNERYPLPEIEIVETVTGVVVASGSSGNEFVTSSIFTGGSYKGNASPFARPMEISDLRRSPIEESFGESGHRGFTPTDEGVRGVGGGQTAKSTYAVKSKNQQNASDTTAIETNVVEEKYEEFHPPQAEPTPPPTPKIPPISSQPKTTPPVVETKVKQPDNVSKSTFIKRQGGEPFRLELAGGTFKADPKVSPLVEGVKGQNFQSASFTASILAVHSPDLIELDAPFVVKDETPEKDDSNPFIAVPHENTSFTIDFEPETTGSTSEVILQSFANITLKNLKTFSGDVHRVKVFTKGFSTQGDFKLVADKLVEGSDILVDTGSVSLSQKVGKFINQNHIDKNWEVKHIKRGPNSETPELAGTATFTSSAQPPLMNSVLVSGSNSKVDESVLFQTKTPKINLRPNVDYTLFVNAVVKTAKTDVLQADGSVLGDQSKAKVKFYLSGSKLGQDLKDTKPASSGSIGNILGDPIKVVQTDDETQGEVITLESDNNEVGKTIDFGRVKIPFKPQFSGSGVTLNDDTKLQVEVEAGELYIQSIELQPSSDTNFNPDEFTFQVPMPKLRKRPDFFDFLVEFYDRNGNKAGYTTIREAVEFDGENDVIQGTDNLLTGSLSIGNALGTGIEAAGVNSAFLRSVDYAGFDSASVSGQGGFLIFSGSVSRSLNTSESYDGVGLELHDGNSGSFKFRTKNADGVGEFDVRTNKFFFGKEGVQFVSGSDDKIEISSSNFHLQADGNLTIGGGAVINSSLSANSILVPSNASNPFEASASISSTGAARFTSASIGGFSVSETAISSSNGELVLKSNGQITGSNFKLDGGTISSGVTIDAAVAANSLSLPAVGTKTAVITAQGEATFSKAEIGSFKIATQEIRSLSGSLILSASGAITASDILATGNITANAGQVFQDVTNLHATSGALETDISASISRSISIEETTGSLIISQSDIRVSLTSSKQESDLVAKGFGEKAVVSASAFAQGAEATASALAIGAEESSSVNHSASFEFTREQTGSLIDFSLGAVVSGSTASTQSFLAAVLTASISSSVSGGIAIASASAESVVLREASASLSTASASLSIASSSLADEVHSSIVQLTSSFSESRAIQVSSSAEFVASASLITTKVDFAATGSQTYTDNSASVVLASASLGIDFAGTGSQVRALEFAVNANTSASAQTASLLSASSSLSDASASLALASASMATQVSLEDDGLEILNNSSTLLAKYGSKTELFAGGNTSNKAILDTGGLAVVQGGVTRSFFGSSITIGKTTGNNTSRVEIASDAVNIINRDSGGTESTVLSFDKTGDVVSDNFLLERTRLFGAGGDGDIILLSNSASVATGSGAEGSGISENTSEIFNEQGTRVCTRTGSVWSLEGDLYANNLTLEDSTGTDITLITSGSRIFVKNELSIHGGCVIHNNGQNGDDGNNSANSDNSTSNTPTLGGKGGFGRALVTGSEGSKGSRGGNPDTSADGGTFFGGNGGGGGGSGGIVFISARFIVNSGSITANGGDGGNGGDGTGSPVTPASASAFNGGAGAAGSLINIKV